MMSTSTPTPNKITPWLFRLAAVLWAIWGVVHIFAGVVTLRLLMTDKAAEAIGGIAAKVDPAELVNDYHPGAIAILSQHALNLAWFGAVTLIAAPFVWRGNRYAIYTAALVGGMADLAYFLFIDLGGFATFPGPQMTYICAAAIITSMAGTRLSRKIAA